MNVDQVRSGRVGSGQIAWDSRWEVGRIPACGGGEFGEEELQEKKNIIYGKNTWGRGL